MWALLLLASIAWGQTPSQSDKIFSLNLPGSQGNFKDCGLVTRTAPNLTESLSPSCFQSLNNIYIDSDGSLDRRGGYSKYNLTACQDSRPIRGEWAFNATDGTKYMVIYSSGSMFYTTGDGTCNMININGSNYWGLSQTAEMQCVQSAGFLWCGNGVDSPFRTDVKTSSQVIAGAPIGPLMGTFRNRILIGGVSGTLTDIYGSGELNGLDWTLPAVTYSTSPFILSLNGVNDGVKTNCFMGEFQNQYLFGRDYDLWSLSGYDNRDFALRKVSQQVGCIEPKSVQEVNNQLIWISKRGVEAYTGTQIQPISYYIRPTISQIIAASGNSRSQLLTSQADWQTGNLTASGQKSAMSATISPGDVVPSSWTQTDSVFGPNIGSQTNVSTNDVAGSVVLLRSTWSIMNGNFSQGNFNNWNNPNSLGLQAVGTGDGCPNLESATQFAQVGCNLSGNTTFTFSALTGIYPSTTVIKSCTVNESNCNYSSDNCDISFSSGTSTNGGAARLVGLNISNASNYPNMSIQFVGPSGSLISNSNPPANQVWAQVLSGASVGSCGTVNYMPSGNFTSSPYDTGFSTPTWGLLNVNESSSSVATATFQTQVSTKSADTYDALLTATPGIQIPSAQKEFIKYKASLATSNSTTTPNIGLINLSAETTGYYISPAIMVSSPTSWGLFNVDAVTNGGSFTFWISTGATAAQATATSANWIMQSPNAQIGVSTTTTYIAMRVLFSIDVATEVPILNDVTFNWNNGSNRPPTASLQYNDRYYLFYTTNTVGSPVNDHVAVFDFNNKWELLDDINAYSATLYLNQPYIGDSNATGTIYQLESGNSDNNGSFNYSWTTGDMSFGEPAQRKNFERLYLFVNQESNSSQNIALTCKYSLDGDNGNYTLNSYSFTSSPSGYSVVKFQFPTTQPTTGHWISINCSNMGTQGPLKTYGFQLIYAPQSWE